MTEQQTTESWLFRNGLCKSSANTCTWAVHNEDASSGLGVAGLTEANRRTSEEFSDAQQWADEQPPEYCHFDHSAGRTHSHVDESAQQDKYVQPAESIDDYGVFQAVLHSLGVRAQHALASGRVQNLAQFMHLRPEAMLDWPNTGAKTVAEIVNVQERLAELADTCKCMGRTLCADEVCLALGRSIKPAQRLAGRLVPQRFATIPTQVPNGPDEPESWSVLRKTIPELLSLGDYEASKLIAATQCELIGDVLDLPEEDWARLSAGAVYRNDQLDIMLFLTLGYLVGLGVSTQSLEELSSVVATRAGCTLGELCRSLLCTASSAPVITEAEISPVRNLRVDSFSVPRELVHALTTRELLTWGDLTGLTEKSIIEESEEFFCAIPMVSALWRMKLFAQQAVNQVSGLPSAHLANFETMMQAYISLAARTPRDRTLLQGRMGLLENRKWTLDELGNLLGLTRERVRQLEQKRRKVLNAPHNRAQLAMFWLALDETLRIAGGVCTIAEVAEQTAIKLAWDANPQPAPLASLLQLSDRVYVDKQAGLVSNPRHRCYKCKSVVLGLESLFVEDTSERTLRSVTEELRSLCAATDKCAQFSQSLSLSEGFVWFVAQKTDGILVNEGVVYCRDTWGSRRGSRIRLVESILKDACRPMHFSEVYQEVRRLVPYDKQITAHNVHRWLGRTDSILLWDRGTFVHASKVTVPTDLVAAVESWLIERLEEDVPFISVAGAHAEFESLCSASGIASESALYSCLRKSANADLCYPRYPQIYLSSKYESRIPAVVALEQYIEDANSEVTYDALRDYALDDLCLKEFQFQQFIYQLSNVIRTNNGGFLYLESMSTTPQPESAENYISRSPRVALEPALAKTITDTVTAHFPNGFRVSSPIELLRFRRFVAEDFGDEISVTDRELMKSIASCGTLSDGKVYVISNEIESRIQDEVDSAISGGAEIIFYNSFYARHEEWLFAGSVISEEMLKDILVKLYPKHMHKANYFTPKAGSGAELSRVKSEIMRVWGNDVILNYKQLSERLPYIPLDKMKCVLAQNSNFIWNATEVYTHVGKVDVTDEECAAIVDYIAAACREYGYASLSDVPLGEIGVRNYELTLTAIHNAVFEIALADKYDRRGKIITQKGNTLDALTIMKEHCRTLDKCPLKDLLDFERELTGESHRWIPMEAGYSVMVRVDENNYIAEDYVHFAATGIDDTLDLFLTGEYLPLKSITTFAAFPHCGQAWNLFLLESYCRRFSDRFRFEVLSVNSRNVGAIIRKSCHLSYFQIMADAVAKSDMPLEKVAILGSLYSSGYIGRRSYTRIDELLEQAKVLRERRD